jgi:hypothetical protein
MIYDSGGGKDLAVRISEAEEWQEFIMFRAVPPTGRLAVTFALTGFGEAWIDGVTISPLIHSTANAADSAAIEELR